MAKDVISYKVVMVFNFKIIDPAIVINFLNSLDPAVIHFLVNQVLQLRPGCN